MTIIILVDYLHDVILMNWHPEGELFASRDGREENVNVTLWAIVFVNLWIVEGDFSNVLDTFVFEDHVVTIFKGVQEGAEGGFCLSHASIIQYACDIATTNRTKSDFFLQGRRGRVFLEY